MSHIAQDVLSDNPALRRPHRPTENYPPHKIAAEYTRQLLPWARRLVCLGRERTYQGDNVRTLRHGAHVA